MKLAVTVLAVAAIFASPASAQNKSKHKRAKAEANTSWQTQELPGQARRAHSPNSEWDVYRGNGEYAGSDPDPQIRAMLRRDQPNSD